MYLLPDKRSSTVGGLDDDVASLKFGNSEPPCAVAGFWGGFDDAEGPMPRDDNREAEGAPARLIKSPVSSAAEDPSTRSMAWEIIKLVIRFFKFLPYSERIKGWSNDPSDGRFLTMFVFRMEYQGVLRFLLLGTFYFFSLSALYIFTKLSFGPLVDYGTSLKYCTYSQIWKILKLTSLIERGLTLGKIDGFLQPRSG